jgi:multidrug transporter EmrE-like cation transporter
MINNMPVLISSLLGNVYFLIVVVGLSSAVGDALINQYSRTNNLNFFLLGCFSWFIAAAFLSQILRKELFAPSVALFLLGNIIIAALIGYFYFGDHVPITQWLWIALAVVAMILIVRG